jgi:hypothetical protein
MKDIIIKKSKIGGKGIFANRDFKKGEIVIDWKDCSEILTKKEFEALPEEEKKYVSFIDGMYIHFFTPGKFVNHSCEANTQAKNMEDVAVRDIKKGEEITADYFFEQVPVGIAKCNCGSRKCRGKVEGK